MKSKVHSKLWLYFSFIVFVIMLLTFFIMGGIAFMAFQFELIGEHRGSPIASVAYFLLMCMLIGVVISFFVARIVLKPITTLSKAASDVAKGNFDIRLNENERVEEIRELIKNFNFMVHEISCIETLRKDFVDNVSHEFKTPITAINGYATLLQDKSIPESEREDYVKFIIESSKQLSMLSENLLKLSRLENQEVVIDKVNFRLDEQIREIVLLLETNWSKKNIELEIDLDKASFIGNKGMLMQVWLNLIDNAIKFTPNAGHIEIRLYKNNNEIAVEIKDNGKGINQSDIHRIFEKFFQCDKARKESGNGLGLALAYRIIKLCDGRVDVQSTLGKGSKFTVYLPNDV